VPQKLESEKKEHARASLANAFAVNTSTTNITPGGAIGWKLQLFVFAIAFLAVVSRRPDALTNPQFFGEDGAVWYPDAYMLGWFSPLFHSLNGYFQTLPRLVSALALLVPLRSAPLLMNLIGITLQVLPVNILLSSRCQNWAPISVRAFMALVYIALPNTRELDAAIEEGQWHLALLACMLVLGCVPRTVLWRTFDFSVILLSGLSGPFSIVMLPIAAIFWWFRRERWRLVVIGILAVTAVIQLSAILHTAAATRPQVGLGAPPGLFLKLLGGQVYLGALIGESGSPAQKGEVLLAIVAILGTAVVVYCLLKARLEIKLFVCFAFLLFVASLKNPMVSMTVPQWQVLRDAPGIRYWFFPMLGFAWALVWCVTSSRSLFVQIAAGIGFFAMIVGVAHDWEYPAFTDFHFPEYARQFAAAAPGNVVIIPIFPDGWVMRLTKKESACSTLPVGHIDAPASGARVSGVVPVAGWVTAAEPVQHVSVFLDRVFAQSVKPNMARPDVDGAYPQSAVTLKGWSTVVDTSRLAPGRHEIEARALQSGGCDADFDIVTIEKSK